MTGQSNAFAMRTEHTSNPDNICYIRWSLYGLVVLYVRALKANAYDLLFSLQLGVHEQFMSFM